MPSPVRLVADLSGARAMDPSSHSEVESNDMGSTPTWREFAVTSVLPLAACTTPREAYGRDIRPAYPAIA